MTLATMIAPAPRGISLRDVAAAIGEGRIVGDGGVRVVGVRQDSRRVEPGDLFAAREGRATSGAAHVAEAIARGACALLGPDGTAAAAPGVPAVEVTDVRAAIARAAEEVYGRPTRRLRTVGVTGTNGKTTTTVLLRRALDSMGRRAGIVGTLGYRFAGLAEEATHTTPEADDLARLASRMLAAGATDLVMEVSSHALAQARVEAVRFAAAAFTNLTQDHLDYHGDMPAYAAAKARLFTDLGPAVSVLNVDDPFGADLARRARPPVLRVSARGAPDADVAAEAASVDADGIHARVRTPAGAAELASRLVGAHNLDNLVLALGVLVALGHRADEAARALGGDADVPGRMERCDGPRDDVLVLVDYAHTPDALARVLEAARPLARGRLVCVFGCGGDRDAGKRAPMGAAVGRAADVAVVTSDNPRTEDARAIVEAILPGLEGSRAVVVVEPDREAAIARAVADARPGDVVVVAGKGHETYQIVGTVRRHFDDREQARAALGRRRAERAGQGDPR